MERGDRELEGEPGRGQRDADQDQRVVGEAAADAVADADELGRARAAVDEGEPVEQGGRAERADDQVLEPGLERSGAPQGRAAEHVERDREQLEGDEEDDQALRLGQQHHAQDRGDEQRLELAVPEAPVERSTDRSRQLSGTTKAAEAMQISEATIASPSSRRAPVTRSFGPSPSCQISSPAAVAERRQGDDRDGDALVAAAEDGGDQDQAEAGAERDDRREAGVVDVGRGEALFIARPRAGAARGLAAATAPILSWTEASPRCRIRLGYSAMATITTTSGVSSRRVAPADLARDLARAAGGCASSAGTGAGRRRPPSRRRRWRRRRTRSSPGRGR